MKTINGTCLSKGIAIGRIHILSKTSFFHVQMSAGDPQKEIARYHEAKSEAILKEQEFYETAKARVGETDAALFLAHAAILQDVTFIDAVEEKIKTQGCSAEVAVKETGEEFYQMFCELPDEYMRARAVDVQDVTERLLDALAISARNHDSAQMKYVSKADAHLDASTPGGVLEKESSQGAASRETEQWIIAAEDLSPSETMQLDRETTAGFVTKTSAPYSHTAIFARSMAIPAVTGIVYEPEWEGQMAIVDGLSGKLILDPDQETLDAYRKKQTESLLPSGLAKTVSEENERRIYQETIKIYANLADSADTKRVLAVGAAGIGLFRSEAVFLKNGKNLTEEEQFVIYRQILEDMQDKPVVIRTYNDESWENGIEHVFSDSKNWALYITQLRALYRASVYGNLRILYPMIRSMEDLDRILALAASVKEELEGEGVPVKDVQQGIMIETVQAAQDSLTLAKAVDFFSIGTNDLSRFVLKIDRNDMEVDMDHLRQHPVLLELIRMTIENAHRAGIPAIICGELGSDPAMTECFVQMGVDGISASVSMI